MMRNTALRLMATCFLLSAAASGTGQEVTTIENRNPLPEDVVLRPAEQTRLDALELTSPDIIRMTRLLLQRRGKLASEDTSRLVRSLMRDDRPQARRAAATLLGGPNRFAVLCVIRNLSMAYQDIGLFLEKLDAHWNTLWEKDLVALSGRLSGMVRGNPDSPAVHDMAAEFVARMIEHRSKMVPLRGIRVSRTMSLKTERITAALEAQSTNAVYDYLDNVHPIRKAALEALGRKYVPPAVEDVDFSSISVAEEQGLEKDDAFVVGVVGSLYTSKGPCIGGGDAYGWGGQRESLRVLVNHEVKPLLYLHPITQLTNTPLPRLREEFKVKEPVLNAACTSDLAMADVLLLYGLHNMRAETIDALEEYVWSGGGIVSVCGPGMVTCRDKPQLAALQDMDNLQWGWSSVPGETFQLCVSNALTAGLDWSLPIVSPGDAFNTGSYMFRSRKFTPQILLRHTQIQSPALRIGSYGSGLIAHFGSGMSFNDDALSKRNWELFHRVLQWAGKRAYTDLRPDPVISKQRYYKKRTEVDRAAGSVAQRYEHAYFLEHGRGETEKAAAIYEALISDPAASTEQIKACRVRLVALREAQGRQHETQLSVTPSADATGSWKIYYHNQPQTADTMELTQQGNTLRGVWHSPHVPTPVEIAGSITGVTVRLDVPIPDIPCRIDATMSQDGNAITNGTWTVYSGPLKGTHPWMAERQPTRWRISEGEFDIGDAIIEATGAENCIWLTTPYEDFEMSFNAVKAARSDFRINIGAPSLKTTRKHGFFYQVLVPWEGGDSRVDYFNNGRVTHIMRGLKNIDEARYHVKLRVNDGRLRVWVDNQPHIDCPLEQYKGGFVGFGTMTGIRVEDLTVRSGHTEFPTSLNEHVVLSCSFDEQGPTVTDGSGKQHHGTVHGAKWTPRGKRGGAYQFDGVDDYIEYAALGLTNCERTVCVWLKGMDANRFHILGQWDGSGNRNRHNIGVGTGSADAYTRNEQGVDNRPYHIGVTTDPEEWSHWSFISADAFRDNEKVHVYKNGSLVGKISSRAIREVTGPYTLGKARHDRHWECSQGQVDELMVFDRALSETETRLIYKLYE